MDINKTYEIEIHTYDIDLGDGSRSTDEILKTIKEFETTWIAVRLSRNTYGTHKICFRCEKETFDKIAEKLNLVIKGYITTTKD